MYFRLWLSLIEDSARESVKYQSTRIWNVLQTVFYFLLRKLLWGESQVQYHMDMECISDCHYLLLRKLCQGERQKQFHKDVECISGCHCLLLEKLLGGVGVWCRAAVQQPSPQALDRADLSNTVPHGDDMYYRLFYLLLKLLWESERLVWGSSSLLPKPQIEQNLSNTVPHGCDM